MQDRTAEYRSAVQSQIRIHGAPQAARKASSKSEFSLQASAIAKNIGDTMQQLQHLTALAKRKPQLDDRPQEVAELTAVIKQRLGQINESIRGLQSLQTGGPTQIKDYTKNVVIMLQGNLTEVTSNFAQVLEDRTRAMQRKPLVREQQRPDNPLYAKGAKGNGKGGAAKGNSARGTSQGGASENPYAGVTEMPSESRKSAASYPDPEDDLLQLPQEQTLTLLEDQQSSYLQSRSSAVDAIESTINELGGIFAQLSSMVAEQRETVQRIDANTDDIALNVSGAHRELLKFYSRVSSNRWLMFKSFGLVLLFFFIWVIIS